MGVRHQPSHVAHLLVHHLDLPLDRGDHAGGEAEVLHEPPVLGDPLHHVHQGVLRAAGRRGAYSRHERGHEREHDDGEHAQRQRCILVVRQDEGEREHNLARQRHDVEHLHEPVVHEVWHVAGHAHDKLACAQRSARVGVQVQELPQQIRLQGQPGFPSNIQERQRVVDDVTDGERQDVPQANSNRLAAFVLRLPALVQHLVHEVQLQVQQQDEVQVLDLQEDQRQRGASSDQRILQIHPQVLHHQEWREDPADVLGAAHVLTIRVRRERVVVDHYDLASFQVPAQLGAPGVAEVHLELQRRVVAVVVDEPHLDLAARLPAAENELALLRDVSQASLGRGVHRGVRHPRGLRSTAQADDPQDGGFLAFLAIEGLRAELDDAVAAPAVGLLLRVRGPARGPALAVRAAAPVREEGHFLLREHATTPTSLRGC
mmetsp:Transcript_29534/g.89368  ORF Transcript_29534/g.89368 Transcript_29534/m.89368 type:complete len:431 (-) Transcript_29534:103-1395(-)